MSAIVVDTSIWIDFFAGGTFVEIDEGLKEGRVYLPPVVAAELLSGKMNEKFRTRLERFLRELPLTDHGRPHWFRVGYLRRSLAQSGISVSTPDAHVAQSAIDSRALLYTRDRIFLQIAKKTTLHLAPP